MILPLQFLPIQFHTDIELLIDSVKGLILRLMIKLYTCIQFTRITTE